MLERVLYVVNLDPSNKYGSLEEQIFLTSEAIAKQGGVFIPVFSAALPEKEAQRYESAGLTATFLTLGRFNLLTLGKLLALIDLHHIDVVHWNLYHPLNGYALLLRVLRPAVRHFLTDHNSRPQSLMNSQTALSKVCKRTLFAGYSKVLAISEYVLTELQKQAVWGNPGRFYYFVNTDRFRPDQSTRSLIRHSRNSDESFIILVVAYLIPEKGVDVVMRAMTGLPDHVVLWIVGDGPERQTLQQIAKALGLENRVCFSGLQADVSPFMQAADCLVIPSLWKEAVGLVILEAMACGLPVIGSAIGGIPEFVIPDETGSLFPAGNHEALADRIQELCASRTQREHLRAGARALAVSQFSHQSRVSDAVAIYRTARS